MELLELMHVRFVSSSEMIEWCSMEFDENRFGGMKMDGLVEMLYLLILVEVRHRNIVAMKISVTHCRYHLYRH